MCREGFEQDAVQYSMRLALGACMNVGGKRDRCCVTRSAMQFTLHAVPPAKHSSMHHMQAVRGMGVVLEREEDAKHDQICSVQVQAAT